MVAPQAIRHPTDLTLRNKAREISEQVVDVVYPQMPLKNKRKCTQSIRPDQAKRYSIRGQTIGAAQESDGSEPRRDKTT